jgi:hypothetical protein
LQHNQIKTVNMSNLSNLNLNPVQLSIEQGTRLLLVKQGDNVVKLTREDINGLQKLHDGGFNEIGPKGEKLLGGYITKLVPKSRCTVDENGSITITCKDEWEDNVVFIANHKKLDDLARIQQFVDKNKGRIAWAREFKGRY